MTPDQAAAIGVYLRDARVAKGLSTRALAMLVGVDMSTIVRIENGHFASPRADTLTAMAAALRLPLADVFAMADYVVPDDLPNPQPYLRAKYPDLPEDAVQKADRYIQRIIREHGAQLEGPDKGEDEN